MINNISSINSESIILNYIFNNFKFSNNIIEIITEEDFFYDIHKTFFLKKTPLIKIKYLSEDTLFSNLLNFFEKSKKRKIINKLLKIIFELINNNNIPNSIFNNINELLKYKNEKKTFKINYFDLLKKHFFINNKMFFTGFKKLDNLLNGIQMGELVILAGRPSIGKTSFAINIIKQSIINKKKILIFSLEMTIIQIFIKILSLLTNINQNNFKMNYFDKEDLKKISFLFKNFNFDNLIIKDCSSLSAKDIETNLLYYKEKKNDIEVVIIDYIQLMRSETTYNNRVLEVSEISRSLKLIAKNYNCVLIVLSQLNRLIELRNEKIPVLSDLRDSGAIEQDADLVIFLHKNLKNNKQIEILISKNRNGSLGNVTFSFKNELTKFYEV